MKLNCCIIAIQKDEYNVEHWIDYHLNYGFTNIYLIDNNDEIAKGNDNFADLTKGIDIPINIID